jgi:hypothetical protein
MTSNQASNALPDHLAPGRHTIKLWLLLFGLAAAPFAWSLAELVLYGIASYTCRMKTSGEEQTLTFGGSWWLWVVFAVTLAIAIAGCTVAIANWRKTRSELSGSGRHQQQPEKGRSRFLAMCGLLTSIGFLIGFVFLLNTLVMAPLCGK